MKKVIFLEAVQNYGGARKSTVELAVRMNEELQNTCKVSLVDFYGSCQPFLDDVSKKNIPIYILQKRESPFIVRDGGSKIRTVKNYFKFIAHTFELKKILKQYIERENIDIIITNNYKTLFLVYLIKNKSFKSVFFARGWFLPQQVNKYKKRLLKKAVDQFLCVSQSTRQAVFAGGISELKNIFVVPNAINEEKLPQEVENLNIQPDEKVILHAGGFLSTKGQIISLEIAKKLKEKNIKFKMILAGIIYKGSASKRFYNKVVDKIQEYKLENNIILITDRNDIIPIFRSADIVIHPSTTEGLPRVVMEAMALKKPVVANAVGGVIDFISNGFTGFLPDYNCSDDYVKYIIELIDNKSLYEYVAENAFNLIKDTYTEKAQIEQIKKILNG